MHSVKTTHEGASSRAAASHSLIQMSFTKNEIQGSATLAELQAVILPWPITIYALVQTLRPWPIGQPQSSSTSGESRNYLSKVSCFEKLTMEISCLINTQNINQDYILKQNTGFTLSSLGLQTLRVTISFLKIYKTGLWNKVVSGTFITQTSQAAGLIEHHCATLRQLII